jgi:hypothetical protein
MKRMTYVTFSNLSAKHYSTILRGEIQKINCWILPYQIQNSALQLESNACSHTLVYQEPFKLCGCHYDYPQKLVKIQLNYAKVWLQQGLCVVFTNW